MAKAATGEGAAYDATVITESNVQRLERELVEARAAAEREALVNNVKNANDKARYFEDQVEAAYAAAKTSEKELADYDAAAEKAKAEEEAASKEEEV